MLTVLACTRRSSSSAFGVGLGTRSTCTTSGPPKRWTTAARIVVVCIIVASMGAPTLRCKSYNVR